MLNSVNTFLRMVPLLVGFSPEAWQVITDVKILKKAGELQVAKMRLIQLMHGSVHSKSASLNHLAYQAPDLFSKQHKSGNGQMHQSLTDGSVSIQMWRTKYFARQSGDETSMYTRLGASTTGQLSRLQPDQHQPPS